MALAFMALAFMALAFMALAFMAFVAIGRVRFALAFIAFITFLVFMVVALIGRPSADAALRFTMFVASSGGPPADATFAGAGSLCPCTTITTPPANPLFCTSCWKTSGFIGLGSLFSSMSDSTLFTRSPKTLNISSVSSVPIATFSTSWSITSATIYAHCVRRAGRC